MQNKAIILQPFSPLQGFPRVLTPMDSLTCSCLLCLFIPFPLPFIVFSAYLSIFFAPSIQRAVMNSAARAYRSNALHTSNNTRAHTYTCTLALPHLLFLSFFLFLVCVCSCVDEVVSWRSFQRVRGGVREDSGALDDCSQC